MNHLREVITPAVVSAILAKAARHAEGHNLNLDHAVIGKARLGTVFVDQSGDYCVYTGLDFNDRKWPVRFTRVHDRAPRRGALSYIAKIVKASV